MSIPVHMSLLKESGNAVVMKLEVPLLNCRHKPVKIIGEAELTFDIADKIMIITNLEVVDDYQNLGFGTQMVQHICEVADTMNCIKIEVDDMTSRFNQSNNIWKNNGFVYLEEGYPEMEKVL